MFARLLGRTVYVKVYANRFVLKQMETGASVSAAAASAFTTDRLLVGRFAEADKALRAGMRQLRKTGWFTPRPVVVIQPMEMTQGGISQVEERVLRELAASAGARKSVVWVGRELSEDEVLDKARGT